MMWRRAFSWLRTLRHAGLTVALGVLSAAPCLGQGPVPNATKFYPDFSDTADALLRNAAGHARDRQWAEAIDIYQRVIQQYGDKVAKLPKDDPASDPSGESLLYVDLRQFCQRRLAALPAEARAVYRGRVDGQAERWFKQGAAERDRAALRRVVEQAYCSSWGDDALDLLGDLAFQDGRFDEALNAYRELVPDRESDRAGLVYPDPSVDLARVAAKKLLCRAALGDNPPGEGEIAAYSKAYPNARGSLAGRDGPYARIVAEAIRGDRLAPPAQPDERWPTFAGSPTRSKVVAGSIDVGSLQWKVELPPVEPRSVLPRGGRGMGFPAPSPTPDRLLGYHPIVLGDQVLVCDESRILAFNLNDRPAQRSVNIEPAWKRDEGKNNAPHAARMVAGIPRYTLTAYGDRVYARLGPTNWPRFGGMAQAGEARSFLIAVDRSTEGKLLWTKSATDVTLPRRPADASTRSTGFEGTPVADARSVYVAMTDRREQTATYVACLDAETGNQRWVRYLGAASSDADNIMGIGFGMGPVVAPTDFGHRLLSLDGTTVYYQTNLGAVVALDAETGGIRWVATYPRQDRNGMGEGHQRDLNPAVVHDGLVMVAPEDATAIFAFDAATGRLVWKSPTIPENARLSHLLGVAKGRLVATGDYVMLYDLKDGKPLQPFPGSGHNMTGYGRGLLAGEKIYWPTRSAIYVLDQATGQPTDAPIQLAETYHTTGGNLAVGDGYLIVAQSDALVVFCQNSRLIERYKEEIARNPDQAANYYRLAQAAEATGREALALESLELALSKARPSESIDGTPLAESTLRQQYRLLMKLGAKAKEGKDLGDASKRYEAAAGVARSDRDRLAARLALATVRLDQGRPKEAVAILQALLADDHLSAVSVNVDDGRRTVRANLWVADRVAAILRDHGRAVYEEFDRKAAVLLERGRKGRDPRLLEEIGRSYPSASVLPDALLALASLQESARRPAEAAYAYKRLFAAAPDASHRARALLGLGRAYEAQRLWGPAREAYERAQSRFGDVTLEDAGKARPVRQMAAALLARAPLDRIPGGGSEPALPTPLGRLWSRPLDGPLHPLLAVGSPPSPDAARVFLVKGATLRPVASTRGELPWTADLGSTPRWAGYLADKLVAATDSRVVALGLARGTVEWQYDAGTAVRGRRGANPFARGAPESESPEGASGRFKDFRIVGDRIFFLSGDRKLVALDGDSGLVDWSYTPPAGTINPNLWIGPRQAVLQVRKPDSVQVLETENGGRRAEFAQSEAEEWPRPPLPVDDEHVALVLDRRNVGLFDLRRGTNAWVFHESDTLPTHGPPRLLGDSERLLVLHDGQELIRLDLANGAKRWSLPLGTDDLSERLETLVCDDQRAYWASDHTLQCASLTDGKVLWRRPLQGPESGWSLALSEQCVLAYPQASGQVERDIEGLPIVLRRRATGEYVQRLLFPVNVSEVSVRLAPRGALVAGRGGLWALGEPGAAESP